jgi:hypothetical protein
MFYPPWTTATRTLSIRPRTTADPCAFHPPADDVNVWELTSQVTWMVSAVSRWTFA